jgi:hypothetical protein
MISMDSKLAGRDQGVLYNRAVLEGPEVLTAVGDDDGVGGSPANNISGTRPPERCEAAAPDGAWFKSPDRASDA